MAGEQARMRVRERRRKMAAFRGCVMTSPHPCYDLKSDLGRFTYEASG